ESRFNLWDHDGRIRVRRCAGERCLPECVLERHSGLTLAVKDMSPIEHVWDLVGRYLARDPHPEASKDEILLHIQIQVRRVGSPIHTGDILRLKVFVYNVCTVRTGVVIHKQKFNTHGTPKQMYMLFQNDIPIDVACHRYTLNMQVGSGTKNNSSPNEPSCTTVTVSFNGVLVAAVAEWYMYRTVACFVTGSSPVPLKTRRVGQRCTLNLSRVETSSRWCGVVVRRGGASSGVVHVT
ncbi:uncharacterized protein TNCV_2712441, partial [Trichonephila clavipes]